MRKRLFYGVVALAASLATTARADDFCSNLIAVLATGKGFNSLRTESNYTGFSWEPDLQLVHQDGGSNGCAVMGSESDPASALSYGCLIGQSDPLFFTDPPASDGPSFAAKMRVVADKAAACVGGKVIEKNAARAAQGEAKDEIRAGAARIVVSTGQFFDPAAPLAHAQISLSVQYK